MKFLAILRDSLRETIDTKVFYVMVGLSGLVTLFALGITFRPRPPEEALAWIVNVSVNRKAIDELTQENVEEPDPEQLFRLFIRMAGHAEAYRLLEVKALDDVGRPWESRYRLVLRRSSALQKSPTEVEQDLKSRLGRLSSMRMVEVTDVKPRPYQGRRLGGLPLPGTGGIDYEVTVTPTTATQHVWLHEVRILYGLVPVVEGERSLPLGFALYFVESGLVIGLGGWVAILVSTIITAFFIPNMLRKGTVDMLLVKPIHRPTLLVYKYLGGLLFILLNTAAAVFGVWLVLGLRSDIWATGFLWTILSLTFYFAILYAVSALFGVLTQNPVASILLTCGAWFFLFLVGWGFQLVDQARVREEKAAAREHREPEPQGWFPQTIRVIHSALPRTRDLGLLNEQLLSSELLSASQFTGRELEPTRLNWTETITVSLAFIAVMLGLACWRFSTKDY